MVINSLKSVSYTHLDVYKRQAVYNVNPQGYYDYNQINSQRLPWFHQLDIRATKKWYFKKWSFELYLDLQNA